MTQFSISAKFCPCRFFKGLFSPLFAICVILGFCGFFLPGPPFPQSLSSWGWFLTAPFIEELTWRALLQNQLALWLGSGGLIPWPNLITSTAFALLHFILSPTLLAVLTFFPSLVFGLIWARFHSLILCSLLHLWYNIALLV